MELPNTPNTTGRLPLLALLTAFPPLATDMYLPAIPLLQTVWREPPTALNLTLVGFFVSYCICLLIYGPLSDRFGRRMPLLAGIGVFILASLSCAFCNGVASLIICRVFQGAGAASASTLALAITKDVYRARERERVLAYIGVIMAVAPIVSPVFGGWMMSWASWRWVFVIQGMIGAVGWICVLRMTETLKNPSETGILQTVGIYRVLLRNRRYVLFAILMSFVVLPHFAFIGGSADIYIKGFGLSEKTFGYFFGLNASAIMAGSFTCTRLLRLLGSNGLITMGFVGILLGGVGLMIRFGQGPWGLAMPMAVISFSFGLSRPPSNNLVLKQVDRHAGAASSLLIFIYFMLGAFSMWLISLGWTDKIRTIGVLGTISGCVMLSVWCLVCLRGGGDLRADRKNTP